MLSRFLSFHCLLLSIFIITMSIYFRCDVTLFSALLRHYLSFSFFASVYFLFSLHISSFIITLFAIIYDYYYVLSLALSLPLILPPFIFIVFERLRRHIETLSRFLLFSLAVFIRYFAFFISYAELLFRYSHDHIHMFPRFPIFHRITSHHSTGSRCRSRQWQRQEAGERKKKKKKKKRQRKAVRQA